ncbi:hypothetical protein Agub_g6184 [Astrephomene gubernaculifera]|uniref:Uncharacterized protein n=1 Tax=Astrephomene gubernaculifera TaxID=47775 RepID=A0AAD3HLC6_9CHLO|nr:hypothetical protein Agub_g6184 [Astrephomene gubernaculifera]
MRLDTGQRVQSQRCKETRRRCVQAAVGRAARRVSPSTMGGCNRLGRAARTPFRPVAVFPFFKSAVSKPPSAEEPVSQQKQQQQHPHHHGHQHHHHHHKFDLPLAVVLAGAAFESYLQPQGGQGFQQRTVGGPTVTYTDKSFLTQPTTACFMCSCCPPPTCAPPTRAAPPTPTRCFSWGHAACGRRRCGAAWSRDGGRGRRTACM